MKRFFPLAHVPQSLMGLLMVSCSATTMLAEEAAPSWALWPFVRPAHAEPVIRPNPASTFHCPLAKIDVSWEAKHTFNPAAVVRDGKVYVLYRAEDGRGRGGLGGYTSRLGLVVSDDGMHLIAEPQPVLFPAEDVQKGDAWTGGCEDPRMAEAPAWSAKARPSSSGAMSIPARIGGQHEQVLQRGMPITAS